MQDNDWQNTRQQLEKLKNILERLEEVERDIPLSARLQAFSEIEEEVGTLNANVLPSVQQQVLRPGLEKLREDMGQRLGEVLRPILSTGDEAEVRKGVRDGFLRMAPQDGPALNLMTEVLLYEAGKLEGSMGLRAIEMWRGVLKAAKDTGSADWQRIVEEAEEAIERLSEPDTLLRTVQRLEDEVNRLRAMVEQGAPWKGDVLKTYVPSHGWPSDGTGTKPKDSETRWWPAGTPTTQSPDSWTWTGDSDRENNQQMPG